jgi:hypothetical protein
MNDTYFPSDAVREIASRWYRDEENLPKFEMNMRMMQIDLLRLYYQRMSYLDKERAKKTICFLYEENKK